MYLRVTVQILRFTAVVKSTSPVAASRCVKCFICCNLFEFFLQSVTYSFNGSFSFTSVYLSYRPMSKFKMIYSVSSVVLNLTQSATAIFTYYF